MTLLPSATEIVCGLGLGDKLVGVTHECDFPAGVEKHPHVTRSFIDQSASSGEIDAAVRTHLESSQALYSLDEALLQELAPDLIVTQALCDVCAVSEDEVQAALSRLPGASALVNLEPMTLGEVFDTIDLLGQAADCEKQAQDYRASLEARVRQVTELTKDLPDHEKPRVGFLEWIDPPFNGGHWTPEIIEMAGGIDCFGRKHEPSHTISYDTVREADPDVLIIALCGFDIERAQQDMPILEQHLNLVDTRAGRNNRIHVMDGNSYFSRPGPRLVDSLEALVRLLHPSLCL